MIQWLSKNDRNKSVVEKIVHKRAVHARIQQEQLQQDLERSRLWKSFYFETAPLREREVTRQFCAAIVNGIVDGVCDVMILRSNVSSSSSSLTTSTDKTSPTTHSTSSTDKIVTDINLTSSDKESVLLDAIEAVLVQITNNVKSHITTQLRGHSRSSLSWLERSALIWLFLCPKVFPCAQSAAERLKLTAAAGGLHDAVVKKWLSRSGKYAEKFTHKWYHIVEAMTWSSVKTFFPRRWVAKRGDLDDNLNVKQQLQPWASLIVPGSQVSLNKFMSDVSSGAKRAGMCYVYVVYFCVSVMYFTNIISPNLIAGLSKRRPDSFINVTHKTKRTRRSDKGKCRQHHDVVQDVQAYVLERWNTGDPCTRRYVCIILLCIVTYNNHEHLLINNPLNYYTSIHSLAIT